MIYLMQLKPRRGQQLTLAKLSVNLISIVETVNQPVVIFDDNNKCLFFNAAAEELLGDRENIRWLIDWSKSLDSRLSKQVDSLPPDDLCSAIAFLCSQEVNDVDIFLSQVDISDNFQVNFKIEFDQQSNFSKEHSLSSESRVLADCISEQLTEEQALNSSLYDKLTQLPNQNLLLQLIQESIIATKKCEDYLFAVLFIDIDRFKAINSSLGRMLGDRLLVEIANRLRKCLRSQDLIARYGGEEFAVILPHTDQEEARKIAEKIRLSIKNLQIAHHKSPVAQYVTLSLGVFTMIPTPECSPELLILLTDKALYQAKAQGRDRVQSGTG